MKVKSLDCPACGAPIEKDLNPKQQFTCVACNSTLVLTDLATDDLVICGKCKTVNEDDKKFCTSCGTTLKANCPFCYIQNNIEAKHCQNCGANLEHARDRKHSWLQQERHHRNARESALHRSKQKNKEMRLQRLLNDLDEPENHPMAIYQLHQFGAEAVDSLIALLQSDDPDARFGSAKTLGLIGDKRAISPLIDCLDDPEAAVRYWAVDSLTHFRAQEAVADIANLLDDTHKGVKKHAFEALEKIGGEEAKQILKQKKKPRWWPF